MSGKNLRKQRWQPAPRPEWVVRVNEEGRHLDVTGIVPLDEESLLHTAMRNTGLDDFGEDDWREGFRNYVKALEEEADFNLIGRILTRSELLGLLENRLRIEETFKRHPEIAEEHIEKPLFITGLPRSGTSIFFEILAQDPACGVPTSWEVMFPCPPPEIATYRSDPRIEVAEQRLTMWNRIVPEYATMHEMGAWIPVECIAIFCHTFMSNHLSAYGQVPSYDAWLVGADMTPAFRYHRKILQLLQWKNPRVHWLLKSPPHIDYLDTLLSVYPDARIVQTHRDPVKAMDSVTDLLGTLYWMRSDRPFDGGSFDDYMMAEGCAARLEHVMEQRAAGLIPDGQMTDVLYADLVRDPLAVIENVYAYFGLELTDEAREKMERYIDSKPKGKFGVHKYAKGSKDEVSREREVLRRYQEHYGVSSEV